MNKEQEIITMENEEMGISLRSIKNEDGSVNVNLGDVAIGFGMIKIDKKNGKEYIRPNISGANKHLKSFGISDSDYKKDDYIPESALYVLGMKANNDKAIKFQMWIATEVLPSIRKNGAYISDNEANINQDYIKYTYGQLKNTFTNCPIETLIETYDECIEFHKKNKTRIPYAKNSKKRSDATHIETDSRIKIMQKIVATLENRNVLLCESGKFGLISEIDNTIKQIKDDIKIQHNKSNGGKIANKTKKINQLQEEIKNLMPSESEYTKINVHGFSHNAMYRHENGIGTVKTNGYNTWIQYFPRYEIPTKECYETNYKIDFTKPIAIYLKYICKDSYDIRNLDKSTLDMIFNRVLCVDDNIVEYVSSEKVGSCTRYEDGKIIFAIRNL